MNLLSLINKIPGRLLVIILLILLTMGAIWVGYKKYTGMQQSISFYESMYTNQKSFTKDGKNHTITTAVEVTKPNEVKQFLMQDPNFKAIAKEVTILRRDLKNLQHAQLVSSATHNSIIAPVKDTIGRDSVPVQKISFQNNYTRKLITIKNGMADIEEDNYDTIFVATARHRKWILGKWHYNTECTFANPNTKAIVNWSVVKK